MKIHWGDGTTDVVMGVSSGWHFSLPNPAPGTPPTVQECETSCGESVRVDYLPERNKLAGVFRMMTYNIHHGYAYDKELCEGDPELWKAASTIRRNDPDIVSINEIHEALRVNGATCNLANQPRQLAEALDMKYLYCDDWAVPVTGNRECKVGDSTQSSGNAILSRYPITFKGHLVLTRRPDVENAPRAMIWGEVTVGGNQIPIYSTHLVVSGSTAKENLRQEQIIDIINMMRANGHDPRRTKMILAGDMNTADVNQLRRLLDYGFNDGFKHISPDWAGYTIPVRASQSDATQRVDYVFTSPLFEHPPRGTAVPWSQSSDHLPVIVDMYQ